MNKTALIALALGLTGLSSAALAQRATEYVLQTGPTRAAARENAIKYAKNLYNHYTVKSISFGECIYTPPPGVNQHWDCKLPVYVERHKQ